VTYRAQRVNGKVNGFRRIKRDLPEEKLDCPAGKSGRSNPAQEGRKKPKGKWRYNKKREEVP